MEDDEFLRSYSTGPQSYLVTKVHYSTRQGNNDPKAIPSSRLPTRFQRVGGDSNAQISKANCKILGSINPTKYNLKAQT